MVNGLEVIERLASSNTCDQNDERMMEAILHKMDFPRAKVTCGIVYLEGRGTLEAPPASIHQIARMILDAINKL